MKKRYRLQPQNATRVRHHGPGLRLAAPPQRPGTAAGRRRQPRTEAPPDGSEMGRRLRPGRTGSKIGADRKRGQTMRKNPLASAIRDIASPELEHDHCQARLYA